MALTVTFDGSNFTLAETGDDLNWADRGGGGASNQDLDYPLEGSQCRGRKIGTTRLGMSFQRTTIDLSTAGEHIGFWFFGGPRAQMETKANGAISIRLGGAADPDTAPWSEWNVAGSDTVPPTNKFIRVWFDVDRGSPDAFSGTFNPNDVEGMGGVFIALATPAGNFNTYFIDRIDRMQGSGGLTGTGTAGTFENFLAFDVDTSTNRQGVVERIPGGLQLNARLTIGTATSAVLNDSDLSIIIDDQQFCESDFMGLTFDLQNAATDIDLSDIKITSAGSINLGDLIVTGTSGDLDFLRVTLDNLRIIDLTGTVTLTDCVMSNSGRVDLASGAPILNGSSVLASTVAADTGALIWNNAADPDGNLDNMTFSKGATAHHAIDFGTAVTGNITLRGVAFNGFGATDDSNDSTVRFLATSGALNLNLVDCTVDGAAATSANFSIDDAAGITVTPVFDPKTTLVNVKDNAGVNLINARVLLEAADGAGDLPFEETITLTSVGTLATAAHTAHGMVAGDKVTIREADQNEYNGVFAITNISTNAYDYTMTGDPASPATGTIDATGAVLEGLTDASGNISSSRSWGANQSVRGFVRKSTASPRFKSRSLAGNTISSASGLTINVRMILDE